MTSLKEQLEAIAVTDMQIASTRSMKLRRFVPLEAALALFQPPMWFTIEPTKEDGLLDVTVKRWHKGVGSHPAHVSESEMLGEKFEIAIGELDNSKKETTK